MPYASSAVDYRSTHATAYPVLPPKMQRSQVEALLVEVAPALGLSGRRLQALLFMMSQTRPQDWIDPAAEPVCYASQGEVAAGLGKTERAVRADEDALSRRLGLLEKRTAANGGRSRHGGLGLVFSRLIELVPALLELRERLRAERARTKTLVRLRSAYFRHLRDGLARLHPSRPADPELALIRDALLAWPPSGTLRGLGLDALEAHVAEARALCDRIDAVAEAFADSSGRPAETFRSHLQDTTEDPSETCRTAPSAATGKEQENRAAPADPQAEFAARLGPARFYALAGPDLQRCLDLAGREPRGLRPIDFVSAAVQLLPQLGVNGSAWQEAVDAMGDFRAALCVLVTDANRDHPATPVRNPGGHLRALARRYRSGQLNLVGSLIGLSERRRTEP